MTKKLSAATLAVIVALVAIWYVALWRPASRQLNAAQATVATHQAQVQQLSSQLAALRAKERQLPGEKAKLAALERAMPAKVSISQVIDEIYGVVLGSGVSWPSESQTLQSATTAAPTPAKGKVATAATPDVVQLDLTVKGSYKQLMVMITALGALPRVAVVDSLSLSGGSSASKKLTATLQARVFYDPSPVPRAPHTPGLAV